MLRPRGSVLTSSMHYQHRTPKVCELLSGVICIVGSSFVRLAGQIEQHIFQFSVSERKGGPYESGNNRVVDP